MNGLTRRHQLDWCFWCARFREIMMDAPWSSYDLAMGVILIMRGAYLIVGFTTMELTFTYSSGNFRPLMGVLGLWSYGWTCLICGWIQILVVLWPTKPIFEMRLLARMGICFCFLVFSFNQISNVPPPIGAITHWILTLLAIWSVLRTRRSGG